MKQLLLSVIALVLTIAATGQTLKITTSSGTKEYQASQVTANQPATFTGGTTLTVGNDVFTISDITSMLVTGSSSTDVEANTVNIVYNGSTATVTMADNVSAYVTAEVSGAHVSIEQTNTEAIDGDGECRTACECGRLVGCHLRCLILFRTAAGRNLQRLAPGCYRQHEGGHR